MQRRGGEDGKESGVAQYKRAEEGGSKQTSSPPNFHHGRKEGLFGKRKLHEEALPASQ